MDLEFYVRVRTCEKRVTGKQPLSHVHNAESKPSQNHGHNGQILGSR